MVTLVEAASLRALPAFEVEVPWWQEAGPVVDGARRHHGVEVTVLRLLECGDGPGGPVTYLVESDPPWPDGLGAPWAGELRTDARRLPWAEPGGPAAVLAWAGDALAAAGREITGPPRQDRTWNLSAIWQIPTSGGDVWLKAVPPVFHHEAAVVAELDRRAFPAPTLVAGRPGVALFEHLPGGGGWDLSVGEWMRAVGALVDLQAASAEETAAWLELGVPDDRLDVVRGELHDLVERTEGLPASDRTRLTRVLDEADDRWRVGGLPAVLVHGDPHRGNLMVDGERLVWLDWGDCTIGHPLFDLAVALLGAGDDEPAVTDTWLGLWSDRLGTGDLRDAWAAYRPLGEIRMALVFDRFVRAFEATEAPYHRGDILPPLRRAAALVG